MKKLDTQWILAGYGLFVWCHFVPSFIILGLFSGAVRLILVKIIWLVMGVALVAMYVGIKGKRVLVLEAGIAAVLYAGTLFLLFGSFAGLELLITSPGKFIYMFLLVVLAAAAGSWVGWIVRSHAMPREQSSTSERETPAPEVRVPSSQTQTELESPSRWSAGWRKIVKGRISLSYPVAAAVLLLLITLSVAMSSVWMKLGVVESHVTPKEVYIMALPVVEVQGFRSEMNTTLQ